MKYCTSLLLFLLINCITLSAQLRLPKIIDSEMVLQRNTTVKIWGWADKNATIKVTGSWFSETVETKAGVDGGWIVSLQTTNSKASQTIKISDGTTEIELWDVLFGEVWLCSGQSNMERSFLGGTGEPVFYALQYITHSTNPNIRLFTVERKAAKTPQTELGKVKSWESANPNSVAGFSAIAYMFGSQLQEVLDVPVGLIHSSWGGSNIISWMEEEVLSQYQEVDLSKIDLKKARGVNRIPTVLFNSMINPITNYSIKGALWYQGESNRNDPAMYTKLMPAMVQSWRDLWDIGDFPFYYVQIAPYDYGKPKAYGSPDNTAYLREAQLKAQKEIPNSGMVVTLDLGQEDNIHPPKKKEVADRLLYQALSNTYGYKTIKDSGPVYQSLAIQSDSAIVTFDSAKKGLYAPSGLANFEIAGADKVFYPATARIINRSPKVLVQSDKVPKPVAVRYGWSNWVMASLYDVYLLPASSFRTDDWEDAKQAKE